MLQFLRRFALGRLGAVAAEDLTRLGTVLNRQSERVRGDLAEVGRAIEAQDRSGHDRTRQIAKRLDRLEQKIAALTDRTEAIDRLLRIGTLRKIDDNVDALIRRAFLSGHLPEPQATLSRRFSGLSQNEEDGLTVALFERMGAQTRRFVEIGAGVNGGNSGFLARECGWTGVMLEIDDARVASLTRRFAPAVAVVQARVTRENVNQLLAEHGGSGDVDLLSIDIDSNDYWIWECLSVCQPRLVIVEYNPLFGVQRPVVVPYDPHFDRRRFPVPYAGYYGASLPALVCLAGRKGYRPVLVEPRGVNAFFVRADIDLDLPTLRVDEIPVATEGPIDLGVDGIFPFLEREGLALVEIR